MLNGEVDIGASPMVGVMTLIEKFKVLGVFNRKQNVYADLTDNAPTINSVFGIDIPDLFTSRAWGVHTEWADKNPELFAMLERTSREAHASEVFREGYRKTGADRPQSGLRRPQGLHGIRAPTFELAQRYEKCAHRQARQGRLSLVAAATLSALSSAHRCGRCSQTPMHPMLEGEQYDDHQTVHAAPGLLRRPCRLGRTPRHLALQRRIGAELSQPPISVVIPTGQGGGAERLARAFDDSWGKILKQQFEYNFFPGAVGPDRLRAVRQAPAQGRAQSAVREHGSRDDHVCDPEAGLQFPARLHLFLDGRHRRQHRLREPDVAVQDDRAGGRRGEEEAAQRRRQPHPASLLDRAAWPSARRTESRYNLIPYGGGNPTYIAVLNGEADIGALPMTGVLTLSEKFKVLGVFNRTKNNFADLSDNAPLINKVFGTDIPDLYSARAWAVHTEWADKNPAQFAFLEKTSKQAFESKSFRDAYRKTGATDLALVYGERKECTEYVEQMVKLAQMYEPQLSAKKGAGGGGKKKQ